jgi:hypothetical protein
VVHCFLAASAGMMVVILARGTHGVNIDPGDACRYWSDRSTVDFLTYVEQRRAPARLLGLA